MRCEDSVIRREKGNQNVRGMFYVEGFDLEAVLSADSTWNSMHPVFEATLHFANLQVFHHPLLFYPLARISIYLFFFAKDAARNSTVMPNNSNC